MKNDDDLELMQRAESHEHLHHLRSEAEFAAKQAMEAEMARLDQVAKDAEEAAQEYRIKMLKSHSGSPDGNHVKFYEQDQIYAVPRDISDDLVKVFLKQGLCEKIERNCAL